MVLQCREVFSLYGIVYSAVGNAEEFLSVHICFIKFAVHRFFFVVILGKPGRFLFDAWCRGVSLWNISMKHFQWLKMTTLINVNLASADDLMSSWGVGRVIAQEIIKGRMWQMLYTRGHKINSKSTGNNRATMVQGGTDQFYLTSKITHIFSHLFSIQVVRKTKGKLQKRNRSGNGKEVQCKATHRDEQAYSTNESTDRSSGKKSFCWELRVMTRLVRHQKRSSRVSKESTAKGINLLEMQGEVKENEKECVERLLERGEGESMLLGCR